MLSDAFEDAFLKQQNERIDERRSQRTDLEGKKLIDPSIFDEGVGNKFNSKKSTVATSLVSEQKDLKKVTRRQKIKHVTSEKQVGYQLSQENQRNREVQTERAATMNRVGTIRSIFTFEQREHLVMSAVMTQYAFGVEGGDAGKEACASVTSALTKTLWID